MQFVESGFMPIVSQQLRASLARCLALVLLAGTIAVFSLVATVTVDPPRAAAQASCNFLIPFGPDPSPNWKPTFANNPDGVEFWIHTDIANDTALRDAVLAGVQTWESASSLVNFRYMGSTATYPKPGGLTDGMNIIGPDQGALGELELGRASVGGTAQSLHFDIELNFESEFGIGIVDGNNQVGDLQSIIVHELGHGLGLNHSDIQGQVMYPQLIIGEHVRELGTEDRACIEQIYGGVVIQTTPTPQPTTTPTPFPTPLPTDSTILGATNAVEVMHTITCLGGNGRVDTNIVNTGASAAAYRIEFGQLSPRQRTVDQGDWWRMPITGRPDGPHQVTVKRDGVIVSDRTVDVACDTAPPQLTAPEVQVVNACRSGNGYLLFQFSNATDAARPYVIEFAGVDNRSTTAAAFGGAIRAVTGRPDGVNAVVIRTGSTILASFNVTIDCD